MNAVGPWGRRRPGLLHSEHEDVPMPGQHQDDRRRCRRQPIGQPCARAPHAAELKNDSAVGSSRERSMCRLLGAPAGRHRWRNRPDPIGLDGQVAMMGGGTTGKTKQDSPN
ncbi:hypothetical protein GUJ93_ZPchr0006g43276 [Zizania palustris]|uniref:Uncharacterized protein n=1 Tax=Zizania palustris TaxID=103762 RepID=A0A8J5TAS4_ZIZPA|nr:hypothetical protein GUJ93_ZPchr0006g43276 [Zizania palustris]